LSSNKRTIAIRHRTKQTAELEARPTEMLIQFGDDPSSRQEMSLSTEDAELDFVKNSIQPGDTFVMTLGGSGDRLAYALSKTKVSDVQVFRLPPYLLKQWREQEGSKDKENDVEHLLNLFAVNPDSYYPVTDRDRAQIWAQVCYRMRIDAMKSRIACEQRIDSSLIGRIFCNEDGNYPEGEIEVLSKQEKANDTILQGMIKEEQRRDRELEKALLELPVYNQLFAPIEGVGPAIAGRIIASTPDIRSFATAAKLKAFAGVHLINNSDGSKSFARRRTGQNCNWNPEFRQALYLLGGQFKYRPNSHWGKVLLKYKERLREEHPQPEVGTNGKKRYTNGHIHKMATWKTLSKFVEWLHREWTRLDEQSNGSSKAA